MVVDDTPLGADGENIFIDESLFAEESGDESDYDASAEFNGSTDQENVSVTLWLYPKTYQIKCFDDKLMD